MQEGFCLAMIELTRLNGHKMVVNSDLIKYAESSPDTMLTLINGEKVVVLEPCEEVLQRVTAYRAMLLAEALKLIPGDSVTVLAVLNSSASGLRATTTELADSEVPDGSDEAAQQRRRRDR
jgi:flagellar protein FlbD